MDRQLLTANDLQTAFNTDDGRVVAVDGVSFHVNRGETLGIVGESGSGKSVTAMSVMRLIKCPPGQISRGTISFEGQDLLKLTDAKMQSIRGNDIAMIFQEPMTSLNPVFTVGDQIAEAISLHQAFSYREALSQSAEMLRLVGIPSPEQRIKEYPHQMSGGMRQRVMIAMALSCRPKLLIADEPTTALDVTIQAQILELMKELREKIGMAIMLITHDLGVIAEMADRVLVMYNGVVLEEAPAVALFEHPLHPYTEGLLASIPTTETSKGALHVIPGTVPSSLEDLVGCRFHPRCSYAQGICGEKEPGLAPAGEGRWVRCWLNADCNLVEV